MLVRLTSAALLLGGCSGSAPGAAEQARAYAGALAAVRAEPHTARERCGTLPDGPLRADCLLAGAEALAARAPEAAAELCGAVEPGATRDECHFQVAERSGQVERCAAAGRFAEDCRMHGWTRVVMQTVEPGTDSATAVALLEPLAGAAGFSPDDPRPWIAAFRHLHGADRPLGTARCAGLSAVVRQACDDAARMLLHDRLSYLRDTGGWPCGSPAPELVDVGEDGVMARIVEERRAEWCP
jgi:hypothetical protein